MSDLSIDLGSALPYLEDKVRALFGKDHRTIEAQHALRRHLRIATREAANVQIVGMDHPISIFDIYQPTRLIRARDKKTVPFQSLVQDRSDGVILGGPGHGKTMLVRYVFATLARKRDYLPLLFTLRWPDAVADLSAFVNSFASGALKRDEARIVLLVDGFDEISEADRAKVAGALRDFASQGAGNFYLTCRSFYPIDDVTAPRWRIAPFNTIDSREFIKAFGKAYGTRLDAKTLIRDLRSRGLADFLEHPLMLALVCILKSGPLPTLPRTTIGLIRRAVDTLTFRWDESKRIARHSRYDLDGDERVRCLLRIAYAMHSLVEREDIVVAAAQEHLRLLQRRDVSVDRLLEELAQWYGILIPLDTAQWSFVHRTIHDFLAARFWVETAGFDADLVPEWNARAAYAACLTGDATRAMVKALQRSSDISAFVECLANGAAFEVRRVAEAVIEHFARFQSSGSLEVSDSIMVRTSKDFLQLCSEDFLYAILNVASSGATVSHDLVLWLVITELWSRDLVIPRTVCDDIELRFGDELRIDATLGYRRLGGAISIYLKSGAASG